jgi:SMP-30/Gluconolactonase/LRE-like region
MIETRKRLVVTLVTTLALILGVLPTSIGAHPGSGIAIDRHGQIYFLDTGSGLWRIDTQGRVTHLSGMLSHWLAIDPISRFASSQLPTGSLGEITKVGTRPTLLLSSDWPITVGQDGNLYYPSGRPGSLRIVRMLPTGATSVVANLPATVSGQPLPYIGGLSPGPDASLYYTEDTSIRRISPRGRVSTVVTVAAPAGAPSIPATNQHPYLRGIAVDAHGVMYVADTGDARVLKITPQGKITTLVETQTPWSPTAVALFGNDVYVLEFLHTVGDVRRDWLPRVRKIASNGQSTIIMTIDQMPGAR